MHRGARAVAVGALMVAAVVGCGAREPIVRLPEAAPTPSAGAPTAEAAAEASADAARRDIDAVVAALEEAGTARVETEYTLGGEGMDMSGHYDWRATPTGYLSMRVPEGAFADSFGAFAVDGAVETVHTPRLTYIRLPEPVQGRSWLAVASDGGPTSPTGDADMPREMSVFRDIDNLRLSGDAEVEGQTVRHYLALTTFEELYRLRTGKPMSSDQLEELEALGMEHVRMELAVGEDDLPLRMTATTIDVPGFGVPSNDLLVSRMDFLEFGADVDRRVPAADDVLEAEGAPGDASAAA
ncbi:hypothetical protein [Allostreptomyces psammosilenae]|uniref:LppX_LprAFG lipoprotein n=1 Tax=Allostreptomyces psammosilenae TaxID=1892865 RepID=A0A852ZRF3_9ACTN|nr:hypothetical protein [Allostreptomyces psammosilenae]NYI05026.1 hypothetical protein [Allostreptomyces psammosilenae]